MNENEELINRLLEEGQRSLRTDYGKIPLYVGVAMMLGGFLHIMVTGEFSFSLTALVWGSIILTIGLLLRYKSATRQVDYGHLLIQLDRQRALLRQRQDLVQAVIDRGVPEGATPEHLRALLGDDPPSGAETAPQQS